MEKKDGDSVPLQTVEEAVAASGGSDIFAKFAKDHFPELSQEAAEEQPGEADEPVKDEPNAEAEQTDLSQNAEQEPEAEPTAEDEPKHDLPPEVQASINKRIGKEVAKTKEAKARVEALEAELEELKSKLDAPTQEQTVPIRQGATDNPLSHITDLQKLAEESEQAESMVEFVENQLDLLDVKPGMVEATLRKNKVDLRDETGQEDFSSERMKAFLRGVRGNASRVLRQVPKQERWIAESQGYQKAVDEHVPELKENADFKKKYAEVLRFNPGLKSNPWWPMAAAAQTLGLMELDRRTAGKSAGKDARTKEKPVLPVKLPSAPKAAPVAQAKAVETTESTRIKAIQSGSDEDIARHMMEIANRI